MKKILYIVAAQLLLASCTLETSDNGKLDGYWHLERIDTIQTGGVSDKTDGGIYWAVENKLIQLRGGSNTYTCHFSNTADSLNFTEVFRSNVYEDGMERGDVRVTDVDGGLREYGIQHVDGHFLKESLKGSSMVLRSDSLRLYFTKI